MSDLINRQSLIDALNKFAPEHYTALVNSIIMKEPSVEPQIIRCKECKFRKIEFGWNGKRYKVCANTDYPTDDNAYCSYGERREEE